MNPAPQPHDRRRFDQMDRAELLTALHGISSKARVARTVLLDAQRTGDRQLADEMRNRISRLKTAASAAQLELALRAEHRRVADAFVYVARRVLDEDLFTKLDGAARAAVAA